MTRAPSHSHGCPCPLCRQYHPADRRAYRARVWRIALLWCALFWAFPGRWLLIALWHLITLHHF